MTTENLNDQVKNIIASNSSKYDKKKALLSIGLTDYEATILTGECSKVRKSSTYTFGVEIECLVPRHAIVERANANGTPIRYEGYNHADNKSYFKFVSDASIHGENPIECVSPVLSSRGGFKKLENACKTLNEAGAVVNRSTGLHVHIGAEHLTEEQYVSVFANYRRLERVVDTFMANSRRADNSQWCKSVGGFRFEECATRAEVLEMMGYNRYFKVNPCSYDRHKTIEFRQHQGSTDFKKISMWVKFCAKLVEWSCKNRLDRNVYTIDEIPFLNQTEKNFFKGRAEQLS